MGPDGKGTAKAAVYIDGQPVQYAGEITLPEIVAVPEQVESMEAPPLLASMGFTMEQFNETARFMAEAFGIFCDKLAEATRAMVDAWEAIRAAEEFRKALRWAEAANRPLAARYHHTKKKRIRKKYAKRILAWYREEILLMLRTESHKNQFVQAWWRNLCRTCLLCGAGPASSNIREPRTMPWTGSRRNGTRHMPFSPPAWAARSCPLRSRAEKPERR